MVLGSFQCRGVLRIWSSVGQGPSTLTVVVETGFRRKANCAFGFIFVHFGL